MTDDIQIPKRQRQANRYMLFANIGSIAVVVCPLLNFFADAALQNAASGAVWLVTTFSALGTLVWSVALLFLWRNTDEFTRSMWHTGTSAAFVASISWLLFSDLIQTAFIAPNLFSAPAVTGPVIDVFGGWALFGMLTAFFVSFQFKRIKGAI